MAAKLGPNNFSLPSGSSDPTSGVADGDLFYNTTDKKIRLRTDGEWVEVDSKIPAPSIVSNSSWAWYEPSGIQGSGSSVTGWNDSSGNNRNMTKGTSPSSNDGKVYKIAFAGGYDGVSAQPNTSTPGNYGGHLVYDGGDGGAGYTYNNTFTCIMAINHTGAGGGTSYNDGWGVVNWNSNSATDGSWSVGPGRIHTWGGQYAEVPGSGSYSSGPHGTGIWLFEYNGPNNSSFVEKKYSGGTWSNQLTGSGTTLPNITYDRHSLLFFVNASNSSHYARGVLGEYIWWTTTLTTSQQNEVGAYLAAKYGI